MVSSAPTSSSMLEETGAFTCHPSERLSYLKKRLYHSTAARDDCSNHWPVYIS